MAFNSRKFYVGVVALEIVLAVYLLYYYFGRTPDLQLGSEGSQAELKFDSDVGKIGGVGIGGVQTAKFTELNDDKEVVREFGFEKLVHKSDQQWEIERPYMDIFNPDFTCNITADRGIIQIDDNFDMASPKDATLIGNVVVRVVPTDGSDFSDVTMYLDDMTFISARSLFLTPGYVRVVSDEVQMNGKGLEFVYNSELNVVEYLKLTTLDELRVKVFDNKEEDGGGVVGSADEEAEQSGGVNKAVTAEVGKELKKEPVLGQAEEEGVSDKEAEQFEEKVVSYRCTFNKNVFIESDEMLVFARDGFSLNNLFMGSGEGEDDDKASKTFGGKTDDANGTPVAELADVNKLSDVEVADVEDKDVEYQEIVLTCDQGILVKPGEAKVEYTAVLEDSNDISDSFDIRSKLNEYKEKTIFASDNVDYDILTDNIYSYGQSDILFYPDGESGDFSTVLKVTSHKSCSYLADSDKVVLEGNCFCEMAREDHNDSSLYTLSSSAIEVDLLKDGGQAADMGLSVERFTAIGPAKIEVYSPGVSGGGEPLEIMSKDKIVYDPFAEELVLEGDCSCVMVRKQGDTKQKNTLTADVIKVKLRKEQVDGEGQLGVKKISATGGDVKLINDMLAGSKGGGGGLPSVFVAERIDYVADSNTIIAPGETELIFYPQMSDKGGGSDIPVRITSKKRTAFLMDSNRVNFEGDCLCKMSNVDPNNRRFYTLSSPMLSVDLSDDVNSVSGISNVSAFGGVVTLISSPYADMRVDDKRGRTAFITKRIDYDPDAEAIVSDGASELTFYPDKENGSELSFPIRITAMKSVSFFTAKNQVVFEGDCKCVMLAKVGDELKNYTLSAPKIIANLSGEGQGATIENMIALGPLELICYVEGAGSESGGEPVEVKITAEDSASFMPEDNSVTFDGKCICTMFRYDFDVEKKYILSSDKIVAKLSGEGQGESSGVDHLTAVGGVVQVSVVEKLDDAMLGFSKVKCKQLDYDSGDKLIYATGPGVVIVDNSRVEDRGDNSGGYDLDRPCYLFLRDFDDLRYYMSKDKVVVQAQNNRLLMDYFLAEDENSRISSTAGIIQINLEATATGQTQISTIHAGRGITYEDGNNQIIANEMFYDSSLSVLTARGSDGQKCMLNGVFVDEIQYDLKAGAVLKTKISKGRQLNIEGQGEF